MSGRVFRFRQHRDNGAPFLSSVADGLIGGKLIPFVGAGVSANKLNDSADYNRVLGLVGEEISQLKSSLKNEPEAVAFLDQFRREFLVDERQNRSSAPKYQKGDRRTLMSDPGVREMRARLARLIVHLTKCHDDAVGEAKFVEDAVGEVDDKGAKGRFYLNSNNPVRLEDPDPEVAKDFLESLVENSERLRRGELVDRESDARNKLAWKLFFGAQAAFELKYDLGTGKKRRGDHEFPQLDIDHLIWLSEFLWTTIVIWVPLYPTSRELTTEISLVSDLPSRTAERRLIRAAECFRDPKEISEYLTLRLQSLEDDPLRGALLMDSHLALACALVHAACVGPNTSPQKDQPVIFTTNFDLGLERAVKEVLVGGRESGLISKDAPIGYRVVYPVLVQKTVEDSSLVDMGQGFAEAMNSPEDGKGSRKSPDATPAERADDADVDYYLFWAARDTILMNDGTVREGHAWLVNTPSGLGYTQDWIREENACLSGTKQPNSAVFRLAGSAALAAEGIDPESLQNLRGPTIVKMHGSPLEDIERLDFREDGKRCHYLVLSEFQYIETIVRRHLTCPDWLTSVLTTSPVTFLGYSIEDWNIRLQLARQPNELAIVGRSQGRGDTKDGSAPGPQIATNQASGKSLETGKRSSTGNGTGERSAIFRIRSPAEEGLYGRLGIGVIDATDVGSLVLALLRANDRELTPLFETVEGRQTRYLGADYGS